MLPLVTPRSPVTSRPLNSRLSPPTKAIATATLDMVRARARARHHMDMVLPRRKLVDQAIRLTVPTDRPHHVVIDGSDVTGLILSCVF